MHNSQPIQALPFAVHAPFQGGDGERRWGLHERSLMKGWAQQLNSSSGTWWPSSDVLTVLCLIQCQLFALIVSEIFLSTVTSGKILSGPWLTNSHDAIKFMINICMPYAGKFLNSDILSSFTLESKTKSFIKENNYWHGTAFETPCKQTSRDVTQIV